MKKILWENLDDTIITGNFSEKMQKVQEIAEYILDRDILVVFSIHDIHPNAPMWVNYKHPNILFVNFNAEIYEFMIWHECGHHLAKYNLTYFYRKSRITTRTFKYKAEIIAWLYAIRKAKQLKRFDMINHILYQILDCLRLIKWQKYKTKEIDENNPHYKACMYLMNNMPSVKDDFEKYLNYSYE